MFVWDAHQKWCLFLSYQLKKRRHFWWASITNICSSYFVRALVHMQDKRIENKGGVGSITCVQDYHVISLNPRTPTDTIENEIFVLFSYMPGRLRSALQLFDSGVRNVDILFIWHLCLLTPLQLQVWPAWPNSKSCSLIQIWHLALTQFVKIAFESVDDRKFRDVVRSENLGGRGRVVMWWAESAPLFQIRLIDLPKSGERVGLAPPAPPVPASLKICKYLLMPSTRSPWSSGSTLGSSTTNSK